VGPPATGFSEPFLRIPLATRFLIELFHFSYKVVAKYSLRRQAVPSTEAPVAL